jgi:hypothetical protein
MPNYVPVFQRQERSGIYLSQAFPVPPNVSALLLLQVDDFLCTDPSDHVVCYFEATYDNGATWAQLGSGPAARLSFFGGPPPASGPRNIGVPVSSMAGPVFFRHRLECGGAPIIGTQHYIGIGS